MMAAPVLERREPVTTRAGRRPRRWLPVAGVIVLLAAIGLVARTTVPAPERPAGALEEVDARTYFASTEAEVTSASGVLWAAGGGRLARYEDGTWWAYPAGAGQLPLRIAEPAPGVVVTVLDDGLHQLVDGTWEPVPDRPGVPVRQLEAVPGSGVLWAGDGRLFSWDGQAWASHGQPPAVQDGIRQLVAHPDGEVWATSMNGYLPELGGFGRYDPTTDAWETVEPWAGHGDVPAELLALAPDGDLWALLTDWPDDVHQRADEEGFGYELALAHLDHRTGEWTVREDLPDGYPLAMAADEGGVWLAQGWGTVEDDPFPGLVRFDGVTWTRHLEDRSILSVAVAADGSVWVGPGPGGGLGIHRVVAPGAEAVTDW